MASPVEPAIRVSGRRRGRFVRALALVALAALPGFPATAFAGPADDAARRMDDRLFFVRTFGRGWEPLLADFGAQVRDLTGEDLKPLLEVRDVAMEQYGDLRLGDGTEAGEKRAFELFESLAREAVAEPRRPDFARKCAGIEVSWAGRAEKAGDDDRALNLALSAARRSPGFEPAYDLIARLGVKQAEKAEARDDFVAALDILVQSVELLPETTPARGRIVSKRQEILSTTGEVEVQWLGSAERMAAVKGPKTDFSAGKIEFRPLGPQKAGPLRPADGRIRIRNGPYEVTAQGDGSATFRAGKLDVVSAGSTVTLLRALPAGMVFVPASGAEDAFLIDRTEVTVTEYRAPGGGNVGGDRTAAAGVSFSQAKAYAAAAGKELPTRAQWFAAAFGDPSGRGRKYPWGEETPVAGTHFVAAQEQPQSVDSCAAYPSAAGCLNMAGNVWEWLAEERFIGGGYRRTSLTLDVQPKDDSSGQAWTADVLRDAAPSDQLYDDDRRMTPEERAKFFNYRPKGNQSTLEQIGLRCVVALGKPSRAR